MNVLHQCVCVGGDLVCKCVYMCETVYGREYVRVSDALLIRLSPAYCTHVDAEPPTHLSDKIHAYSMLCFRRSAQPSHSAPLPPSRRHSASGGGGGGDPRHTSAIHPGPALRSAVQRCSGRLAQGHAAASLRDHVRGWVLLSGPVDGR